MELLTADKRKSETGIKGVIYGPAGIGKTSLLYTLPEESTLCIDLEAGLLAADRWKGDSISIRKWEDARALAGYIGGANPGATPEQPYSEGYYQRCVGLLGDKVDLDKYDTIFIDSITVAARLCKAWTLKQPDSYTKEGALNMLRAYGNLATEMMNWLIQLQHTKGKNIWFVGILDRSELEGGSIAWEPQIEGGKTKRELAGIVDQIITMQEVKTRPENEGDRPKSQRAFICKNLNPWGYPAKDRSGTLDMVEPPHLGNLMQKIKEKRTSPTFITELLNGDEIIY